MNAVGSVPPTIVHEAMPRLTRLHAPATWSCTADVGAWSLHAPPSSARRFRDERRGRIFIDYTRNAYAQTTVAPYAVRAKAGAAVATPIEWKELEKTSLRTYAVDNVPRRLGQKEDPWSVDLIAAQSLSGRMDTLTELQADVNGSK